MPIIPPGYGAPATSAWAQEVTASVNNLIETSGTAKPWRSAWGELAYAQVVANQATITTAVDLTGLTSGSITPPAGRKLKVTLSARLLSSVAGDRIDLFVANGSNTVLRLMSAAASTVSVEEGIDVVYRTTSTGTALTFKARAQRGAGSGNLTMVASSTSPAFILVEDIGPT